MFIQTESPIPTQPPKNAFNSQLKKQTECLNWLNLCEGFIHSGGERLSETRGSQPAVPQLMAHAVGSFSQRTLHAQSRLGVASWILEPGQWLLFAMHRSAEWLGSVTEHLGLFRLFLEVSSPSSAGIWIPYRALILTKCWIHTFWKTGCLKNMKNLSCAFQKNVCSWASFSNVTMMVLKAVKYGLCSIKPSFVVCFLLFFFFFKFPFMFVVHLDH